MIEFAVQIIAEKQNYNRSNEKWFLHIDSLATVKYKLTPKGTLTFYNETILLNILNL